MGQRQSNSARMPATKRPDLMKKHQSAKQIQTRKSQASRPPRGPRGKP